MSSTTVNRPSGAGSSAVSAGRPTRFGDLTSPATRSMSNDEDKTPQGSLGPSFRSNTWQTSSQIWGNGTLGSGFTKGMREASRSRVAEDDEYQGPTGSGALAASSEAMSWGPPWSVDNTSPTMSSSGTTSPERHRASVPLALSQTSPYLTTSRTAIGHGTILNNAKSSGKSSLDGASGSFKYTFQKAPFTYPDEKETISQMNSIGQSFDNYGVERTWRPNSSASRDNSSPPSMPSESSSSLQSGAVNGSIFGNGQYSAMGHAQTSSLHMQRPPTQGRTPSFPSSVNGRSFTDLTSQVAELDLNLNRLKDSQNSYMESSAEQPYASPSTYSQYVSTQVQPGSTSMWATGLGSSSRTINGYFPETSTDTPFAEQLNPNKANRFGDRGPASPGNGYRRQPTSPGYYHMNEAASAELESTPLRNLRSQSVSEFERGLQRQFALQQQYPQPQLIFNGHFQGQYPQVYEYPHNFSINPHQHGYQMPAPPYTTAIPVPRGPARDQDLSGVTLRSQLLEEFRVSSKTNRRYELKDIYKHVVEFSGDQHGSRFIQQKLETANSDEKDQIFRELFPNALQLMTDVFGNYVIQKFFEHGNQLQKRMLAECMKNHVVDLAVQMYGCRVVQKALEHVLSDQQAELVKELQHDILKCVKDQNGNHVIQKAIERVPTQHIQFIIEAFKGQVHTLATHPYGCRVIQRMLEYCSEKDQAAVLEELHICASMLITDQYGNYVMQHVIEHGKPTDRAKIIRIVTSQLLALSKHKFASNVVEKTIQFGSDEQRRAIVAELTSHPSDGSSPLQLMMKDQYGNYVIQKLLAQLKGAEREQFVEDMRPQLIALKKYNYGKQITAIEKLISTGPQTSPSSYNANLNMSSTAVHTPPIDINSTAATPMLTIGQNSPESSSLPSTNASTADGPTQSSSVKSDVTVKGYAELRIEKLDEKH